MEYASRRLWIDDSDRSTKCALTAVLSSVSPANTALISLLAQP